ncbi:hypothetical protein [Heyndrickxia acidicola]|uniref:Uncharacterized protein n=1 Tax=Heyndrickxia acidicola TaxID=209389 RepID=A0ABU6MAY2_9BACI|nr:hypothetical protein [Heyndrickxia acidicola]MED1201837.1 hypothetical protein [Heyndrickxia acidicola]
MGKCLESKSASRKDWSTFNISVISQNRTEPKVDCSEGHETPAGKAGQRKTPQELATGMLPAARGKRVPAALK